MAKTMKEFLNAEVQTKASVSKSDFSVDGVTLGKVARASFRSWDAIIDFQGKVCSYIQSNLKNYNLFLNNKVIIGILTGEIEKTDENAETLRLVDTFFQLKIAGMIRQNKLNQSITEAMAEGVECLKTWWDSKGHSAYLEALAVKVKKDATFADFVKQNNWVEFVEKQPEAAAEVSSEQQLEAAGAAA